MDIKAKDPLQRLLNANPVDDGGSIDEVGDSEVAPAIVTESNALQNLVAPIELAAAFAKKWEALYRPEIFRTALAELLRDGVPSSGVHTSPVTSRDHSTSQRVSLSSETFPDDTQIGKLARLLEISSDDVARTVAIGQDGKVTILARVSGHTKKELQTKYSLIYLYVCEMALGVRLVDIEELRKLCVEQGCYDLNNFTANFRKDVQNGLLREQGEKGGRIRRYLLSQKGISTAAQLLRDLAGE